MGNCTFLLAYRLACSRRNNNLISSTALMALSFLPLVVALQVTQTMAQGIIKRYLETSSYHFKIIPLLQSYTVQDFEKIQMLVKDVEGVKNIAIEENSFGVAFTTAGREGVLLRGVMSDFYTQDEGMRTYLSFVSGSSPQKLESDAAFIGEFLAKNLKLGLGDTLRILVVSSENQIPSIRSLKVKGIFSVGYHELDKGWVFLNKDNRFVFPSSQDRHVFLGVKVVDPFKNYQRQAQLIQNILPQGWFVLDWKRMNVRHLENFRVTTLMLFFVFGLMVCVGATMNAGSLYIFFLSRRKEIALLKALGLPPHRVRNLFIVFGFLVGLIGILIGTIFGSLITINMHTLLRAWYWCEHIWNVFVRNQSWSTLDQESFYLHHFVPQFRPFLLLWTSFGVLVWSTVVNLLPSSRIAKMKVLKILRKI